MGYVGPTNNLHEFSRALICSTPNFIPDHRMNMKFGLAPGDCEGDPINNCLEKAIERFQPA